MGLYSTATISADAVKLCVFDLRRGQREGDEVEKILFFYPSEVPLTEQLSVIGLSEGLITFTRLVTSLGIFLYFSSCNVRNVQECYSLASSVKLV